MRVLVTGAGALLGQGIIRSIRASELDAYIIAVDPSPLAAGLYWADAADLVPMAAIDLHRPPAGSVRQDAGRRPSCRDRCRAHGYCAATVTARGGLDAAVVVSSQEVVRIADEKYRTAEFLRQAGFVIDYRVARRRSTADIGGWIPSGCQASVRSSVCGCSHRP